MNASYTFPHSFPQSGPRLTDHGVHQRLALVVLALGLLAAGRAMLQSSHAAEQPSADSTKPSAEMVHTMKVQEMMTMREQMH
jgi:hypothetical protein